MKQLLQTRGGDRVVHDVPAPACPPGGVLVRNAFSAISAGTERASAEQPSGSLGRRALARPDLVREVAEQALRQGVGSTRAAVRRRFDRTSAIGYSSVGRTVEVGTAVRGLAPGDVVACAGVGHANHAEVVAIPRNLCARVPDGVPLPAAALTTIAAVAMHGIRLAEVRVGDRCAVIGCGLIGQIACRLLRAAGAEGGGVEVGGGRSSRSTSTATGRRPPAPIMRSLSSRQRHRVCSQSPGPGSTRCLSPRRRRRTTRCCSRAT
jgi:threonine dehydrogenase-like Zn-dependent dehydrogenase